MLSVGLPSAARALALVLSSQGITAAGLRETRSALRNFEHVGGAALRARKDFSFTLACITCLHPLLAILMKVVEILSDLVGPAAPREDLEFFSVMKTHSYYLKRSLWCLLEFPVPCVTWKVTWPQEDGNPR